MGGGGGDLEIDGFGVLDLVAENKNINSAYDMGERARLVVWGGSEDRVEFEVI